MLNEPAAQQTDPTVLDFQLCAISTQAVQSTVAPSIDSGKPEKNAGVLSMVVVEAVAPELQTINGLPEEKFAAVRLILGSSDQSDLRESLGLGYTHDFAKLMLDPIMSMAKEWQRNGSNKDLANWECIVNGTARDERDIPFHVKESFITGHYHGGILKKEEYDAGHDGWDLDAFVNHPISILAGLERHHVTAARFYTSDSYTLFNRPMRNGTVPHTIKVTMYVLDEMLRKMQKVEVKLNPLAYADTMTVWRRMKDMDMDLEEFKRIGGVELAPMSTSGDRQVANLYANGQREDFFSITQQKGNQGDF